MVDQKLKIKNDVSTVDVAKGYSIKDVVNNMSIKLPDIKIGNIVVSTKDIKLDDSISESDAKIAITKLIQYISQVENTDELLDKRINNIFEGYIPKEKLDKIDSLKEKLNNISSNLISKDDDILTISLINNDENSKSIVTKYYDINDRVYDYKIAVNNVLLSKEELDDLETKSVSLELEGLNFLKEVNLEKEKVVQNYDINTLLNNTSNILNEKKKALDEYVLGSTTSSIVSVENENGEDVSSDTSVDVTNYTVTSKYIIDYEQNLLNSLNEKIKYYKTPRNLQLAKSFEFACLNAKGEFIIPLGSDDGIMPYTLTEINKIMEKYPEEDIIQWERGFYAWPGFNDGQQNEFVIPRKYNKLKYETEYVSTEYLMALILNEPSMMYSLPLMYVNSGFRRRYLKRILERTGRLWDGICQDLYMGIVNITINKRILMVKYPMTIAGMSSTSIGCLSNKANRTVEQGNTDSKEIVCTSNIGGYVTSCTERLIPQLRSDVSSLYLSILRLVARGVIPQTFLTELFDFKKWFIEIIGTIKKEDVYYDKYIHYIRHVVKSHNEDFQKWFEEKVWPILIRQSVMETSGKENLRSYDVGVNAYGGVILDASEYCVENILDAVELLKDTIFKIK